MTPPPVPAPAQPADPATSAASDDASALDRGDETADLFTWMSWSAAIAMNA